MTYQELDRYRKIKLKIKSINAELANLTYLSTTNYDGMPHGSGIGDATYSQYAKRDRLYQKLEFKKKQAREELERIENFLDTIDDVEMEVILRMRFVECRSYESIGDEMFMHLSTVKKKIDRFLKIT